MSPSTASSFSHFDLEQLPASDAYKLLASLIMPRPIAWVTSTDAAGTVNAAPFSFFNVLSSDPPVLAIGFSPAPDRDSKDTFANITARHTFIVNLVSEELAEAMNLTATNAPRGTDEAAIAGLEMAATDCGIPRIADSPASFECRLMQTIWAGPRSAIVLARIHRAYVRDDVFADRARLHLDSSKLRLVGRMESPSAYNTTRDLFHIARRAWPLE